MMMQMVGAFAAFDRALLKERTKAGLDAAREEGRIGGRRPKLSGQQQSEIRKMITKGDKTAARCRPVVQGSPRNGLTATGAAHLTRGSAVPNSGAKIYARHFAK